MNGNNHDHSSLAGYETTILIARENLGGQEETIPAGCSKWPSSKAAGESKPEAYPLGYVEDFDEPRTKLAGFFSILLARNGYRRE